MNTSRLQLRALLARRQHLIEEQHSRLARRIHDEISQKLTLLALQLSLEASEQAEARLRPPGSGTETKNTSTARSSQAHGATARIPARAPHAPVPQISEKCKSWASMVIEIGQTVRDITDVLQPKVVEEFGLVAGLQWYASSLNEEVRCTFTPPEREVVLPPGVGRELFGICWEVITSIFRPETTSHVDIQVRQIEGALTVHLHGNDKDGRRSDEPERELDVMSVTERVLRLGGTVEVSSAPGSGTTVTLCLPPKNRRRAALPPVGPKLYAQGSAR